MSSSSTPTGVSLAIIGTGRINRDKPEADQLVANLSAAVKDAASEIERKRIEEDAKARHDAAANYFQERTNTLVQPTGVAVRKDGDRVIVEWNTALAGAEPLRAYEIFSGKKLLASIPFRPQLTEAPLSISIAAGDVGPDPVTVVATESAPRRVV